MNQNLNPLAVLDHPIYHRLLELLRLHRFATTTQLARLTSDGYATARSAVRQTLRHLNRLLKERLVLHLERRIGGWQGGSSASIWALTTRGLSALTGQTVRHATRRYRPASWLIYWRSRRRGRSSMRPFAPCRIPPLRLWQSRIAGVTTWELAGRL